MIHIVGKFNCLPECWQRPAAVMLGNFDGLHKGHQKLIEALREYGPRNSLQTAVFSFSPHPKSFFLNETFHTIYTSDEKTFILNGLGVDVFLEYVFDEYLAHCSPEDFVGGMLVRRLGCKAVVVGEGYRFGHGQAGDSKLLQELGFKYGMDVIIVPHLCGEGIKVSSSVIREYIRGTRFQEAAEQLTRPYFLREQVVHGRKMGREMGFPTINQQPPKDKLLPPNGVYATTAHICGSVFKSVTNIGRNPTLGELTGSVAETHLIGFQGNAYGETAQIDFHQFMRAEMKFSCLDALKWQIEKDIAARLVCD